VRQRDRVDGREVVDTKRGLPAALRDDAVPDRAASCGPEWQVQSSPNGRPHFALTAEHLFDLDCAGPTAAEDFFEWRDDYPPGPDPDPQGPEQMVDKEFNDYVERTGADYAQWYRAPWMTDQ
jgi:hypothetical protein